MSKFDPEKNLANRAVLGTWMRCLAADYNLNPERPVQHFTMSAGAIRPPPPPTA